MACRLARKQGANGLAHCMACYNGPSRPRSTPTTPSSHPPKAAAPLAHEPVGDEAHKGGGGAHKHRHQDDHLADADGGGGAGAAGADGYRWCIPAGGASGGRQTFVLSQVGGQMGRTAQGTQQCCAGTGSCRACCVVPLVALPPPHQASRLSLRHDAHDAPNPRPHRKLSSPAPLVA